MQPGTSRRLIGGAASLAVLLAACGGQGTTPGGATPSPKATPKPDLVARPDNLPQGVVRVQVQGSGRLLAHLDATGLVPRTAHAVQLRRGSCLQRGGALLASFGDATSNAAGALNADLGGPAVTLAGGEYLELHLVGAAQLAAGAVPIACADIASAAPSSAVRLTATPGFRAFGTVSLTYDAAARTGKLGVALQAFAGRSVHAVQILSGTCAAPGGLLHAAGDITADAGGTVKTALDLGDVGGPPPASGWIVVVRSGATDAIGTPAVPTPQAQPILCGALTRPAST